MWHVVTYSCFIFNSDSLLQPLSNVCACPNKELTFICNVTGKPLVWIWQNSTSRGTVIYAPTSIQIPFLNQSINVRGLSGVSTTLLDLGLNSTLYVTSILQFTPSNELLPANVTCNDQMCRVRIKGKKKFNLELRQHTSL